MPVEDNFVKKIGRILYVDPNDVFGSVNGIPMTPDYSDMSISFTLECRVMPRYKKNVPMATTNVTTIDKNSKQQVTTKYQLNWNTPYGGVGENNWVSFLQGTMYNDGGDNSLTTYYTDINYDDYKKQTIVEGLGIENITVSYENYYTPTIVVKFVDHRGSSLFGREEVTHYDNNITIDSIFGAFFTAPYPLFRLQIKGFYGRAVTYQMTCSSFKGSLNSQTGNFEATATFIGYSYSLLTDIPFEYLVAAPYCEYFGKDYWDSHKGKEEWQMYGSYDGDDVPTFFELIQRIEAAFTNESLLQVLTETDKKTLDESDSSLKLLESMFAVVSGMQEQIQFQLCGNEENSLKSITTNATSSENKLRLYFTNENINGTLETANKLLSDLKAVVVAYNKAFEDDQINEETLPKFATGQIKPTKFFTVDAETNKKTIIDVPDLSVEALSKVSINGIQLTEELCNEIITTTKSPYPVKEWVYLIDWGTIEQILDEKMATVKTKVDAINAQTERNYIDLAVNNLGFVPYIGNLFKLVICHIETFLYMMNNCYLNIENAAQTNQRTPAYLGIPVDCTDIVPSYADTNIPPWPLITKSNDATNYYLMMEKEDTYGWVGDFSPYFEEAKLVRALYLACKRTLHEQQSKDVSKPVEFRYFPIIPNDLNNNANPFIGGGETLSSMAGMIGLRAAQIFGVGEQAKIDDDIAKTLGKVDALNYYRFLGNKTKLATLLEQQDENLADTLYDIMLCKSSADKYGKAEDNGSVSQDFEFAKAMFPNLLNGQMKDRHPIYVELANDLLCYTYLHTKSFYGLIPTNTINWPKYPENFTMIGDKTSGTYFEFHLSGKNDQYIANQFLHKCGVTQLFSDYAVPEDKNKYVNNEMYYIATDKQLVDGILKRYSEMKSGSISLLGEKFELDLNNVLDRYWAVDDSIHYMYQTQANGLFTRSYTENKIEKGALYSDGNITIDLTKTYNDLLGMKYAVFENNNIKCGDEEVDLNNLFVTDMNYCWGGDKFYSLFGSDFYYLQNQIEDTFVRQRVKALLFLHTLPYNKDYTMAWDLVQEDSNKNHSMIRRIPFGFAALYGGLLWRHNYIVKYGHDPIKYSDKGGISYIHAYEKGKAEYSLYSINTLGKWYFYPKTSGNYSYRIFRNEKSEDLNAIFMSMPDYFVVNELIKVFEEFVSKQWVTISSLELTNANGAAFVNGTEFNKHFSDICDKYYATFEEIWTQETTAKKQEEKKQDNTSDTENKEELPETTTNAQKTIQAMQSTLTMLPSDFTKKYSFFWFLWKNKDCRKMKLWLNIENAAIQDAFRSVYTDDCIELRSSALRLKVGNTSSVNTYTDITVSQPNIKSYISGFSDQLSAIVKNTNNGTNTGDDPIVVDETPEFNRETALPIYMYLKMLWDKWLVAMDVNDNEFLAKNFNDNFVFIDSFYRNIADRFMVNCQILLDCYNNVSASEDITTFKFLTDVVNKHQLMFVGLPDFVSGLVDYGLGGEEKPIETMKTIFTPVPYNSKNPIDKNNKFAVIYIPRLSEIPSELNNYTNDSFDIIDTDCDKGVIKEGDNFPLTLRDDYAFEDQSMYGLYLGYSYYVPSFGLAYGRQNNHIFKNINLSMETPIITSTVINTLSHISARGANNTHRVAFIGQDLYPVFSNYSYICEFEMMGNAQIQPLMYFQLMNVPMWRGTYIIFNVTHTMTPGNMVTKVKAMKLSNRAIPYSNAWFTENPNFDPEALRRLECLDQLASGKVIAGVSGTTGTSSTINTGQYGSGIFTNKTFAEQLAICEVSKDMTGSQVSHLIVDCEYKGGVGGAQTYKTPSGLNKHVVADIQAIAEEVAKLGWFDFYISSAWRQNNAAYGHRLGIAVDINCPDNNQVPNPWFNHHFCKNDAEPAPGTKFNYPMKKYNERKEGYDRTKCIWYFNHPVAQIFRAHGWNWGGQFGDVMHFDLRGQDCANGGNNDPSCPSTWMC